MGTSQSTARRQLSEYGCGEMPHRRRVVSVIAEAGTLFILSAVLMMFGCFLLTASPLTEESLVANTLKVISILEAYQLLLLVMAHRILRLLNAGSEIIALLMIGLCLLLDPTCQSTVLWAVGERGALPAQLWLLALVPIKFAAICALLKVRPSARTMMTWCAAIALSNLGGLVLLSVGRNTLVRSTP